MKSVIVWAVEHMLVGIGRRVGSMRGAHSGLQLMGYANMTAECAMCDKSTPGILIHRMVARCR